jgi:adhesin/invasin
MTLPTYGRRLALSGASVWTIARIAVAAGVLTASCSGDDLTLPGDREPAALDVVEGNNQSARIGAPLPDPVVVRLTDASGRPVVGAAVTFRVTSSSGGTLTPAESTTDEGGEASSEWSLGTVAGTHTAEARTDRAGVAPAELTAFAAAGVASRLRMVAGDNQTAPAGTELPESLIVRATDASGNPVEGVGVAWNAPDGGSVSAAAVATDATGRAGVRRTLGPAAGSQTTIATAPDLAPVTFSATATSGSAGKLTIVSQPSADAVNGVVFAQQPRIQLVDAFNNPVSTSGIAVTASLSGNPDGVELRGQRTVSTDASGAAQFSGLSLVGPAGSYAVRFTGASLADVVSRAIALEPGPVSDSRSSASVQPSSIVVVSGVATLTVVLRDAFGFPIGGATVVPSSNRSGGAFTPTSGTSDNSGKATFAFGSSVVDEFRLSATVGNVELEDRPRVVVTRAATSITIQSDQPDPSTLFQPVAVTFSAVSSVGAPLTGTVLVREDGGGSCSAPASAGTCDLAFRALGRRTVTATYQGDPMHTPSESAEEPHDVQLFAQ